MSHTFIYESHIHLWVTHSSHTNNAFIYESHIHLIRITHSSMSPIEFHWDLTHRWMCYEYEMNVWHLTFYEMHVSAHNTFITLTHNTFITNHSWFVTQVMTHSYVTTCSIETCRTTHSSHSCDEVCCSVLQCVAVCCSVLQCVAVCCSVLQCVAVCCITHNTFITRMWWVMTWLPRRDMC